MSSLPPPELQSFAARLAKALVANDMPGIQALCSALTRVPAWSHLSPETSQQGHSRRERGRDEVGIWVRDSGTDLPFRRDEGRRGEWRLWADRSELPTSSKGRRRIVFIGESAARGYFYDPDFAPATVLDLLFRHIDQKVDVIDLARSDIDPAGVIRLAEQARTLKPDLLVVFAGNNWSSARSYDRATRARLISALEEHDCAGYIKVIEDWRRVRADVTIERLSAAAKVAGVPVIIVVPETNLVDWREDFALVLPGVRGADERWFELARQAQLLLAEGLLGEAREAATELGRLDGGTSPMGPSILARCHLLIGETEEALGLFEAARDVRRALPLHCTPGCPRSVQTRLAASNQLSGMHVIDLRRVFRDYLGQLPDRRLFLDYCHLSSAGIRLLVRELAKKALYLFGESDSAVDSVVQMLAPAPSVDADAHFMAAVHCARWQQPTESLAWHCSEALRYSAEMKTKLLSYYHAFKKNNPPWLSNGFDQLVGRHGSTTGRYFGEVSPYADVGIREESLSDHLESTFEISKTDTSVTKIDLLSRSHFAFDNLNSITLTTRERAYVEFYEPVSRFVLHFDRELPFRLLATIRTPIATRGSRITIRLNGADIASLVSSATWSAFEVESHALSGRNVLEVSWPPIKDVGAERKSRWRAELRRNVLPNLLNNYGHLFELALCPR